MVKEALDPLTEKEQQIVRVFSLIDLQRHMTQYPCYGKVRKLKDLISMGRVGAYRSFGLGHEDTKEMADIYYVDTKEIERVSNQFTFCFQAVVWST